MSEDTPDEAEFNRQISVNWVTLFVVFEMLTLELIKARGGPGPWLDELRARLIVETKNIDHWSLRIEEEPKLVGRAVRLVNGVIDGAIEKFKSGRS
jgi:hypothetical protein